MPVFTYRSPMPVSRQRLWAWHASPGAFARLAPPWDPPRIVAQEGDFAHRRVTMEVGPLQMRWVAQHHDAVPGEVFHDRMVSGPFAAWDHAHRFEEGPAGASVLVDHLEVELPGGAVGRALGEPLLRRMLDRMFAFRHRRTLEDLVSLGAIAPLRIAITGATGLVGSHLVPYLQGGGHTVHRLVRRAPAAGSADIQWDPATGTIDAAALEGVDAVIHLAGENVGARWSPARRAAILESRVKGTALLARTLAGLARKPRVFVSASAVGFYGYAGGDQAFDDTAAQGGGYLAEVCRAWEAAAEPARAAGIRVVHPRIGVVLSAEGGALGKQLLPAQMGAGGPIGTGRQWLSWIALDDVLAGLLHLVTHDDLAGPVNLVAPHPVPQRTFARTLGHVLGRPAVLPLPAFAVRAAFGEMGEEVLLGGQRVVPTALLASGYAFFRPDLEGALRAELGRGASVPPAAT